jgi:hypothetical protein
MKKPMKGREEGREEAKVEAARAMLSEGFDPVLIAKITELPIEKSNSCNRRTCPDSKLPPANKSKEKRIQYKQLPGGVGVALAVPLSHCLGER